MIRASRSSAGRASKRPLWPRLHGHELRLYGREPTRRNARPPCSRPSTWASPCSTRPRSTARTTNEDLLGRCLAGGRRDRVVLATKFGFRIDAAAAASAGLDSRPGAHPGGRRGLAARGSGPTGSTCSTSTGWTRPCRSRRSSGPWRTWSRRARCATWACPRRAPPPCAGRMPCTRSAPCSPSTRSSSAASSATSCLPAASSASASCPTRRSAAAS